MRLALICIVLLSGCAVSRAPQKPPPLGPGEIVSARAAEDALTIGKTTKADVRAALGEATVLDFASGYEVWAYREKPPGAELVLLFEPSGILAKTRVR